jgi:hypothetical protein
MLLETMDRRVPTYRLERTLSLSGNSAGLVVCSPLAENPLTGIDSADGQALGSPP